jgi:hypothetical protein
MKRNLLFLSLLSVLALTACKKVSTEEPTDTLEVTEKNSVIIAKHTWTGCGPCGGWGFTNFQSLIDNNPDEVHIAFKRGNVGGYDNQAIYDFFKSTFDIQGGTPTFHYNLDETSSLGAARDEMDAQGVIANANYEMEIQGDKIILKTTTKFFKEAQGTFRIAPYLVVDNLIGNQAGHPDGANTAHKKVPVDIARPLGAATSNYAGYVIADGDIKDGYTVNLECEVDIDPSWDPADISFALMIFRDNGNDNYGLINTFTK